MRRQTLIMIVGLFLLIGAAAVAQFVIGSDDDRAPLPGPGSPGQLPSPTPTLTAPASPSSAG